MALNATALLQVIDLLLVPRDHVLFELGLLLYKLPLHLVVLVLQVSVLAFIESQFLSQNLLSFLTMFQVLLYLLHLIQVLLLVVANPSLHFLLDLDSVQLSSI